MFWKVVRGNFKGQIGPLGNAITGGRAGVSQAVNHVAISDANVFFTARFLNLLDPTNLWLGWAFRYQNPGNYYHMYVRQNGRVFWAQIKNGKVVAGREFGQAPGTWPKQFRVRVAFQGEALAVNIDRTGFQQFRGFTEWKSGLMGPITWNCEAEFKNIKVRPAKLGLQIPQVPSLQVVYKPLLTQTVPSP